MRKYPIFCIILVLAMLLVGCSDQQKSNEPILSNPPVEEPHNLPEEPDPDPLKELTASELQENFQRTYESCGSSRSQEDAQIAVELDALQKAVADIPAKLPENFESRYREWRSAEIAAQIESDRLVLMVEYAQIIGDRPVYAPAISGLCEASSGLCYAEYIDFDKDGLSELLLISAAESNVTMEVYGLSDGHAAQYGKVEEPVYLAGSLDILLCEKDGQISLGTCSWSGGTAYPFIYSFYIVGEETLKFSDAIFAIRDEIGVDTNGWTYKHYSCSEDINGGIEPDEINSIPVKEISEEQYNNIFEGYGERNNIFSGSGDKIIQFTYEPGIAPASPVPSITVNGNAVELGTELYGESNHIIGPLRPVLEAMGIPVYSNAGGTIVVASTKKDTLSIIDGGWLMWRSSDDDTENWGLYEDNIKFNGEKKSSPVEPKFKNDQLYVPISSIVRMFGATAEWDEPSRTLSITSAIPSTSLMSKDELNAMIKGFSYEEAVTVAEQKGYRKTWSEWDIYDYFIYAYGKVYYSFYVLPADMPDNSPIYYYATVGSDGTISLDEQIRDLDSDW